MGISVWRFRTDPDTGLLRYDLEPIFQGTLTVNQFEGSLPHNVHVENDKLWASYYEEGVVVWDITVPWDPIFMAQTLHEDDQVCSTWGIYPHHPAHGGDVAYASATGVDPKDGAIIALGSFTGILVILGGLYFLRKAQLEPKQRMGAGQISYDSVADNDIDNM